MIITFIAVIIVMLVMNYFMITVLNKTVKRVNKELSTHFIKSLSVFDEMYIEKETEFLMKWDKLRQSVTPLQNEPTEKSIEKKKQTFVANNKRVATYRNFDFLTEYKAVKDRMRIEKVELIGEFIQEELTVRNEEYMELLAKLIDRFSFETMYNIITLEENDQYEVIDSALLETEKYILEAYMEEHITFDCLKFLEFLNGLLHKYDSIIYVKTGEKNEDFNYLDKRINTQYDESICEGLKIIYRNKLFDYSI